MDKKEAFKDFLKRNRDISKSVMEGKTDYQKLYEMFDIYGEEDKIWDEFRSKSKTKESSTSVKNILNYLQGIDLDKLEENVSSLEKALGFLEEIIGDRKEKKEEKSERKKKNTEIERFFDD